MTLFLKPHEVAREVGMSTSTLRRLEKEGAISGITRTRSGQRVYAPEDVERILRVVYPDVARE